MIILVDSGNTRIKLAWYDERGAAPHRNVATALDNTDIEGLDRWLDGLPEMPTAAVGVNVAGARLGAAIAEMFERHGCTLIWMRSQAEAFGLVNGYAQPEKLGADRWAYMVGVLSRHPARHAPLLLACFGTATTLDTIDSQNRFVGGLILPGPAMMRSALASGTANLPLAQGDAMAFPTDTHAAIASGVAAAQAGAVVRQWLECCERFGAAPLVYVAGGGWPQVADETESLLGKTATASGQAMPTITVVEHPVLEGLARIASAVDSERITRENS